MGKLYVNNSIIESNSPEYTKKVKEYMDYIDDHIKRVKEAYKILFKNFKEEDAKEVGIPYNTIQSAKRMCSLAIESHDDSKYSDEEFYGYRSKYFKTLEEQEKYDNNRAFAKEVDENYELAWEHHYKNNNHHPKYWLWVDYSDSNSRIKYIPRETIRSEAIEMPIYAILEMLCDWYAMSMKFNNKVSEWYTNKADEEKKDLNPNSKIIVDKFIEWIKNHKE